MLDIVTMHCQGIHSKTHQFNLLRGKETTYRLTTVYYINDLKSNNSHATFIHRAVPLKRDLHVSTGFALYYHVSTLMSSFGFRIMASAKHPFDQLVNAL